MSQSPVNLKVKLKPTIRHDHWISFGFAALVYGLDALSKAWIIRALQAGESQPVIPGIFHITRVHNTGAAFSMFYEHPEVLTLVSGLLLVAFLGYMLTKPKLSRAEIMGFGFVIGGAFGNLMDRIRLGAVTDFLDVVAIRYPVFNLADAFILMGVVVLMVAYVKQFNQSACR